MKNKNIPLKVAFWGNVVLTIMIVLWGTFLQACPFVLFAGLAGGMIWGKKDYKIALIVIAGLMALLNLTLESGIDTLFWVINIILVIL